MTSTDFAVIADARAMLAERWLERLLYAEIGGAAITPALHAYAIGKAVQALRDAFARGGRPGPSGADVRVRFDRIARTLHVECSRDLWR